jgi:hypothetical protein
MSRAEIQSFIVVGEGTSWQIAGVLALLLEIKMGTELYPTAVTSITTDHSGLWPVLSSGGEVDLRQEFYEFLYGSPTEIPKGRPGILRRMRTDNSGDLVVCPCVDEKTGEPDRDTVCPYCWGEGYYWDEEWVTYYKVLVSSHEGMVRKNQPYKPGVSNTPFVFFYLEHSVAPSRLDKIVEVSLDTEGSISLPYTREAIYPIATAEAFRSDNGRIEYWRVAVVLDSVKSNWQG